MPVITLEAGRLNTEQKSQLVKEFTNIASKAMNVPAQAFIVLLKENEQDNIGFGGHLMSERNALRKCKKPVAVHHIEL
jgi:Uncharacterized protein, 4-oxalocrotonate tautomerase homolog